jgi:hypothetical protein
MDIDDLREGVMYYFVVDMPVNWKDEGPEMNPYDVAKIYWQIWDQDFQLIATYETEDEATYQCSRLNRSM